ncbi:hypothetical protein [Phascolarctobacterium faecium]|uniref:hypothetical protein n=2 Tax=Phascolarctobacterium faecium TaxID=33025 RepID=UPI00307B4E25
METLKTNVLLGGHQRSSYRLIPKLLLQLHALTDNPMNITVTGNITVSATLEAQLPSSETFLYAGDADSATITIPAGVNVVKAYAGRGNGNPYMQLYHDNNVLWSDGVITYVGVTPNKSYKLLYVGPIEDPGVAHIYWYVSYSSTINQQTPSVTDY